ncbi:phosphatase PAP2 family protein [Sulfitobacter pseudonitzschiae]|uniref:Phosphatase PAP2 family protein n=1 Tax=Pseudosulfitobacter pseudonitzschiae TaxID=1402135 RepID=A0A9Q2RTH9_9RHOB|nr:bifunctional DedA family/phosphatase PAP2 family protein [Pseudosulfitobacter pseudonitzschiae]MBM2291098.1 phosphatase PAP2 family protein [Pseudosulfitobacter pseudonitzschiae]MBM2296016.1 phosphatase PAP2 family protein [Pseudosulfitobacter pseudonitzschiae]MBM2300929.1 phosphatase PAP2 family protein [Pseudosulfitobacter pseudonitzschiae]MBM2310713.1 phosphatase PAP2 family protein [Pseudosulfitobacter pseudonitzschiae]MBM2315626.1 phosphatase PAP2 family protein [Pseudosulfitobacter ps
MSGWASHILPSLESLGLWSYWIIGAASMLESFFLTGVVVPGTLIVDAGGALVRLGRIDFFDLVWFVAIGAILGGEMGFWLGRYAKKRFPQDWAPTRSRTFLRAQALFDRRGGMALVLGRFLGPVAGLVPLAAALTGMPARTFRLWNIASAFPYALAHVAIGYAAGDLLARIGPVAGRAAMVVGAVAVVIVAFYVIAAQVQRGLPLVLRWMGFLRDSVVSRPRVRHLMERHPSIVTFLARRFDVERFDGLTLTMLIGVCGYLVIAWADTAFDFLRLPQVAEMDLRLARLIHAFWTPELLKAFGLITQLGHWPVVLAVFLGATVALALTRRWPSLVHLCVALGGELITVRLLKGTFARPRPDLGYFIETSGSFPSGHATLSVAFWGTLVVILWREKLIGIPTALLAAGSFAVLIGGSRLYLIEHFLSDVVNGWIVGAFWLVIGFGVAEWFRHARPLTPRHAGWQRAAAASVLLVATVAAGWGVATANPPLATRGAEAAPKPLAIADIGTARLPVIAETLTGAATLPVQTVIRATDPAALESALTANGWTRLDSPSLSGALHAVWKDLADLTAGTAPAIPMFWNGHPQDMTFRDVGDGTLLWVWKAGVESGTAEALYPLVVEPGETASAGRGAKPPLPLAATTAITVTKAPTQGQGPEGPGWSWDGTVTVGSPAP